MRSMHAGRTNRKDAGLTAKEVALSIVIVAALGTVLFLAVDPLRHRVYRHHEPADPRHLRQISLAAIMYGGDYDDRIPLVVNGRWDRLQNRHNQELTLNCPGPGTQDLPSPDAAGSRPSRTWVELVSKYLKSRAYFVSPDRGDPVGYFKTEPRSVTDKDYYPDTSTYRNQGRFVFYGLNYMFLSPIQIPKGKLGKPNAINYAEGLSRSFTEADDPSGTVFFVDSQQAMDDPRRGFFVVSAPGMWQEFANNKKGYVAFWDGRLGEWSRNNAPCENSQKPCVHDAKWAGFVWNGFNDGTNATFLDGHVKYCKTAALAAGTSYAASPPNGITSVTRIVDPKAYVWDLKAGDFRL